MNFNKSLSDAKRLLEGIRQIAPDLNLCDRNLAELEQLVERGEAVNTLGQSLHGQLSALVATRVAVDKLLREVYNGMACAIRACKHPKREELLRYLGFKLPWEFEGPGSDTGTTPPPSGQAPMAA